MGLGYGGQHEGVAQGVVEAVAVDKRGAVEKEVGTYDVVDGVVGDGFVECEGGVLCSSVAGVERAAWLWNRMRVDSFSLHHWL